MHDPQTAVSSGVRTAASLFLLKENTVASVAWRSVLRRMSSTSGCARTGEIFFLHPRLLLYARVEVLLVNIFFLSFTNQSRLIVSAHASPSLVLVLRSLPAFPTSGNVTIP